ncbi:MAG: hypothetical protein K0R28_932, partial [Paenibacillus sp.]|nr:hypothetical protein [Paenibacillus sp.]
MALKKKSIYGLAFALILAATFIFVGLNKATASPNEWTDHAAVSWFDPTYTTFTIDSAEKLAGVAKLVNDEAIVNGVAVNGFYQKILEVDTDLDLSAYDWIPIGTHEHPFKGTLIAKNGQTFDIAGMKLTGDLTYAGLVGYMDGATVGGFNFISTGAINVQTVSQQVYGVHVGSAVGKMINTSTVFKITNDIPIVVNSVTANVYVGGIIGAGEGIVADSVNLKAVTAAGANVQMGGIAGYADDDSLKIKKVTNNGAVSASGTGVLHAGGIAGFGFGSLLLDEEDTPISNTGDVTVTGGQTGYAGGIIGRAGAQLKLSNLTSNSGAVTINAPAATGTYAGALAGAITASQTEPLFNIAFVNSKPVVNNGGTNVHTGIWAGWIDSNFTWGKSYTNTQSVTATGTSELHTGGLIGRTGGDVQFNSAVKNAANVTVSGGTQPHQPDEVYTGGLIGHANKNVYLNSTASQAYENSGAISVTGREGVYTGGIISHGGYARTPDGTITNVLSNGNITVNGQSKLYTGGFVGIIANDGNGKSVKGATFDKTITVTATASDASRTVSTGGIVGYYAIPSESGSISESVFKGTITSTGGGAYTYTGGIAGYVDGGTIAGVNAGDTALSYPVITADGTLGGIAGYLNGKIDTASVKYLTLTMKMVDGFAGGIAGNAQGTITGATAGDASYSDFDSVKLLAAVTGATGGTDRVTSGGIIGRSGGPLSLVKSQVARVGLVNDATRNSYTFGSVAGLLTADAVIGEAGIPVGVSQMKIDVLAADSSAGGAIGMNRSPKVYVKVEDSSFNVSAVNAKVGGIAGTNDIAAGTIATTGQTMKAQNLAFTVAAQGSTARVGGLFGDNLKDSQGGLAENVTIASQGASSQLGGAAGRNIGFLNEHEAVNVVISASAADAELGGIVGRSEAADLSQPVAKVNKTRVLAKENTILTATGANAVVGGIAGYASSTEVTNSKIEAVIPDYAVLSATGTLPIVGGLVGRATNSKIAGDAVNMNAANLLVTVPSAEAKVGGLSGYNDKTRIENVLANKVNLVVSGINSITGGMTAYNLGSSTGILLNNSVTDLNIKVNAPAVNAIVGGMIGLNDKRAIDPVADPVTGVSTIQNSRIEGDILVTAPSSKIGGAVGENRTLVANSSIPDKISVTSRGDDSWVGGFAGLNGADGILYYTYSNANLHAEGTNTNVGGLAGDNKGQVIASYVDIDVTGDAVGTAAGSIALGGLVGVNTGSIDKSYTVSTVTANGAYTNVGGLVGEHTAGTITNSYASTNTAANGASSYSGGFVGRMVNGTITTVYSAGQASAANDNGAYAGGFAGRYDNIGKELLFKAYYVKDEDHAINKDLPDFAEGNYRFLNVHARLSTILEETLGDRNIFPGLSGWDFGVTWKYGSLDALYKYPEINRIANTGGDNPGTDVNGNINWYVRDKDAVQFELKSEAELAGLASIVNGTVPGLAPFSFEGRILVLKNPIHIQSRQWVPIGSSEARAFEGTFNGNNYLIDGLTMTPVYDYSGLFGVIGQQGKVQNMNMEPLSVAGSLYTGVLAGYNRGTVSNATIKLLNGVQISGGVVGGVFGKNTGAFSGVILSMDGGSRVAATGIGAIAGGLIGDNASAVVPGLFQLKSTTGSVGSSASGATVGGLIGKQAGEFSGFDVSIASNYTVSATGPNAILGGLIGRYASGLAHDIKITFTDNVLLASGAGSTLGGFIGQSDAGNVIRNVTVTTAVAAQHMTADGTVGGIVGSKTGQGSSTFDIEHVKTQNVTLATLGTSNQAVIGGIAGKLADTAVNDAVFTASIQAAGNQVTAGGIVGDGQNSILYKVDAVPDITAAPKTGVSAIGGIAGVIASSGIDTPFDFGKLIPFYRGIYEANVHTKPIQATGASNAAELRVGGIAGVNSTASIYLSKASSDLSVTEAKIAAVGGIVGVSNGIIVSSFAENNIRVDSTTVYHVGGVAGQTTGGELHYSAAVSSNRKTISIGRAVTRPDLLPAAHIGGFIGTGDSTKITHSFADIAVQIVCDNQDNTIYAGGFAGMLGDTNPGSGLIRNAYAKGTVEVNGITGSYAGGFAGSVDRYTIENAYADGNVTNAAFDTRSGGFAGVVERGAVIRNSYAAQAKIATTGVNHATRSYTGGFAGYNDGTIERVFAGAADISTTVKGANAYTGALVGYNFRDGKVTDSSYMTNLGSAGHNIGSVNASFTSVDATGGFGFGGWNFELNPSFLSSTGTTEITVADKRQLAGAATLYNAGGLDFYKLYNRSAAAKPILTKITLGADIEWERYIWAPFDTFNATFDGAGYKIRGLYPTGLIADNFGQVRNVALEAVNIKAIAGAGAVAATNRVGATISDVTIGGAVQGAGYVGGAVSVNEGTITGVKLQSLSVEGTDDVGGVAADNKGTIGNTQIKVITVKGGQYVGGVSGKNTGTVNGASVEGAITGSGQRVGGIVGSNEGAVANVELKAVTVAGGDYTAGIAGENKGAISMASAKELTVKGASYVGGAAGTNSGTIEETTVSGNVTGVDYTAGIAGENKGTISKASAKELTLKGGAYVGGTAGANSGTIGEASVSGSITGSGQGLGGIAGTNGGQITKSFSWGSLGNGGVTTAYPDTAAGGIAGLNASAGTIGQSFSFMEIEAAADQLAVGGIAGRSEGAIANSYFSGRALASGTVKAWAGGIAGYAAGGTISDAMSYGVASATVGGNIVPGQAFFGGIAGQKAAASAIERTAFNKQMLRANTAYYDAAGVRISGDNAASAGYLSTELASGALPSGMNAAIWKPAAGYFPQLAAFYETDVSKLSTAAVMLDRKDTISAIKSGFELTGDT